MTRSKEPADGSAYARSWHSETPKLSYRRTMQAWFLLPSEGAISIEASTRAQFSMFIVASTPNLYEREHHALLSALDSDLHLGKWYVLEEIVRGKLGHVALYASREEAMRAMPH